jgi:hypothetical protein
MSVPLCATGRLQPVSWRPWLGTDEGDVWKVEGCKADQGDYTYLYTTAALHWGFQHVLYECTIGHRSLSLSHTSFRIHPRDEQTTVHFCIAL